MFCLDGGGGVLKCVWGGAGGEKSWQGCENYRYIMEEVKSEQC